jgi:hypothetical protein
MNATRTRHGVHERQCGKCRRWLPAKPEHFAPRTNRSGSVTLKASCRRCLAAQSKHYRERVEGVRPSATPKAPPDLSLPSLVAQLVGG